jgi:hypothetical protein
MPFIFNFDEGLTSIKTVNINPKGWKNPITIEYCSAQARIYDTMISICWRIKGTTHTFTIYENQLNKLSHGDYAQHFTEILELFREDYKSWFEDEKYQGCEWRDEYRLQYGNLIL